MMLLLLALFTADLSPNDKSQENAESVMKAS